MASMMAGMGFANVATRWHPELALQYEREIQKPSHKRGTCRDEKDCRLAVDWSKRNFEGPGEVPTSLRRRPVKEALVP